MKKLLVILMSVVLLATNIPFATLVVNAASGWTVSDAIVLKSGKKHTVYWSDKNRANDCYNKITVPSRGYISFTIKHPPKGGFELCLHNKKGDLIWRANTIAKNPDFTDYCTFKIGLAAGTYYMNIWCPSWYGEQPFSTWYRYKFTAATNWEIENNDSPQKATTISLNKKYYAIYAEERDDVFKDYFKVKLTKGKSYSVIIGNARELDSGTAILDIYDPKGNSLDSYLSPDGISNDAINEIKAKYTGYYYIVLRNDFARAGFDYTIQVKTKPISVAKLKIKLSETTYTYNGKVKKPSVTVKDAKGKKISSSNYTVTYASGRKNVGKYKVVVKFNGINYSGTKTLYFSILPPKSSVQKLTSATTKIKVYVSRKNTQVTGYQIQYSTNKSFKSYKNKNIGYKVSNTTLTGLKRKTTYYVRVRTYKVVNGSKVYSLWSPVKRIKTK